MAASDSEIFNSCLTNCFMQHINYNSAEHQSELTKAPPMAPLKLFICDSCLFPIIIEYFVLINIRKLGYNYCCIVAMLISFDIISFLFVQEGIFAYFNLYHYDAG